MGALAVLPKEQLFDRIKSGEMPVEIAQELGVGKSAISERYGDDPEYLKAREIGMDVRLQQGELAIDAAGDDLNLARVREIGQRRREWRAEREFPHRWGAKQEISIDVHVQIDDKLSEARSRLAALIVAPTTKSAIGETIDGQCNQVIDKNSVSD